LPESNYASDKDREKESTRIMPPSDKRKTPGGMSPIGFIGKNFPQQYELDEIKEVNEAVGIGGGDGVPGGSHHQR